MYNLLMFCGFLYVSSVMGLKYARSGDEFVSEAWRTVGDVVKMLHLLMILEVLHPLFGYTKGSVVEAALQVGYLLHTSDSYICKIMSQEKLI